MLRIPLLVLAVLLLANTAAVTADLPKIKPQILQKIEAALPDSAPAKPKKARKVLLFSKTNGFRHGSIAVGVNAIAMLGKKTGAWDAVHSEDDSMFEPETLKQFDAVIMVNTTGALFRPRKLPKEAAAKKAAVEREDRLKKSLVDFVKSGKGLAGTHSATDTYKNWKDYGDMMGGAFAGHPWHTKVPVKNLLPSHPLNKPFDGKGFEVTDEIYQFRAGTANPKERSMLLCLDGEKMDLKKGRRKDGLYPISWLAKYGDGRTFYCSLGHRNEIYHNPVVLQHYLAGFQYVLGDLEADAKPHDHVPVKDAGK